MTPNTDDPIGELEEALSKLITQQFDATRDVRLDRWFILIGCIALILGGIGVLTQVYSNFSIALICLLVAGLGWLVAGLSVLKLGRDRKKLSQVQGLVKQLKKDLADAWITRVNKSRQS